MKTFSINDIPEFSKKKRLIVVGVIGKSAFRHPNKTTPLVPSVPFDENGIQCFWDERNSILYLHAVTYMDTNRLVSMVNYQLKSETDSDLSHWLVTAGNLAAESCKLMALVFHLSHIVVLSSPTSVFDMGYLQIFKAINALRLELSQQTSEAVSSLGGNWESHGRSCCPRLLFHFHRAPQQLKQNPAALKRLGHTVEDQLYSILRKARIITNVCAKALFAIPKNEEFVYMSTDDEQSSARDIGALVQGLVDLCNGVSEKAQCDRPTFREFLNGHVELAFSDGFDDNVGKYAMTTCFFELPSASSWREAATAIAPIYLQYDATKSSGALYDSLATDQRFSEARCAKVLPIAQASYNEGLPSHYSSQHHKLKLSAAINVFSAMARGPRAGAARARLAANCEASWRSHRLCETLSLTGNPCVEAEHDHYKDHSSGVRYISACNCGRTKCSREDPYTVKKANFGFYEQAAKECGVCPTITAVDFPVFQPSTTTYRAASIPGGIEPLEGTESWAGGSGGWAAGEALSLHSEDGSPTQDMPLLLRGTGDKTITRQPSTTEYLPGMLHTRSPLGLLPAFPSWSLKCLGAASLYSHGPGLGEQLQPGLLPHAHHLTPWDARVEQPVGAWGGTRRGKSHLTVKIFIGFEYECPRGHRFMMSSPESVVSSATAGGGARLARSDMPLRATCPARAGKCASAQCTRVHVVTPKAPVHVTLQPRVQPIPGGPIFIPQPEDETPIKLSASSYWILRLPFIYADERGPLARPTGPQQPGLILAPMFGLTD